MLRYTTDRARPDLVAIRPGNGAGQNPGARTGQSKSENVSIILTRASVSALQ